MCFRKSLTQANPCPSRYPAGMVLPPVPPPSPAGPGRHRQSVPALSWHQAGKADAPGAWPMPSTLSSTILHSTKERGDLVSAPGTPFTLQNASGRPGCAGPTPRARPVCAASRKSSGSRPHAHIKTDFTHVQNRAARVDQGFSDVTPSRRGAPASGRGRVLREMQHVKVRLSSRLRTGRRRAQGQSAVRDQEVIPPNPKFRADGHVLDPDLHRNSTCFTSRRRASFSPAGDRRRVEIHPATPPVAAMIRS
jgi:hypothetical protein